MSNAGGAIVAIRLRKERQIVAALRERSAVSQMSATPIGASHGQGALRSLIRHGAVTEAGVGSYYLNEDAYGAMQSKRRFRVGLIVLVVFVAAALSYGLSMANG